MQDTPTSPKRKYHKRSCFRNNFRRLVLFHKSQSFHGTSKQFRLWHWGIYFCLALGIMSLVFWVFILSSEVNQTRTAIGNEAPAVYKGFRNKYRDIMREVERRLRSEIIANEIRHTFTENMCNKAKQELENPVISRSGSRRLSPWYTFRASQGNYSGMIMYSGLRIYPSVPTSASAPTSEQVVTIVAHLTIDRLSRLAEFTHRLDTKSTRVSAAIFIPMYLMTEEWKDVDLARKKIAAQLGCVKKGRMCDSVDIHVVYGDTVDTSYTSCADSRLPPTNCLIYPIQELRNIATSMVKTVYMFSVDIDFIPSSIGLFKRAMAMIQLNEGWAKEKKVYVVTLKDSQCGQSGKFEDCKPLDYMMPDHPAQAPSYMTRVKWEQSTVPQEVEYKFAYEPYFLGPTANMPRYDERFSYGNDKVQQVYDTAAAGFKFYVLPPSVGYLIHWEHDNSAKHRKKTPPLARTQSPHSLLASVARRAECVWPGSRDRFICNNNYVRRKWWWFWALSPGFYKIAGCKITEHRAWPGSELSIDESKRVEMASMMRASATRALPPIQS